MTQIASINKFSGEDFDSDGNLDVVLAGNLYNAEVETPRADGSFGLYLKGDGTENFIAHTMMKSELKKVGDVRDIEMLYIKVEKHILAAKNDDQLQLIKVNSPL